MHLGTDTFNTCDSSDGEYEYEYISRVWHLKALMHLGLKVGPLCPMSKQGSPEAFLKLQMAPRVIL
jgi:hypothetical protein